MRITQANSFDRSLANLQRRQEQLSEAQDKLTSGKRVQRASDDPLDAVRAERARAADRRAAMQERALDASRHAMQVSESTLGQAAELLQQVRERLVAAGNGAYSDDERSALGRAIRDLRDDLLALANRSDGAGRFVFGGQGADEAPFVDAPGGVAYQGTGGLQFGAAGEPAPLAIDGRVAWLQAPDPANPGATLSLFDTLDRAVAELLTPGRSSAQVAQTVSEALGGVDASATHLGRWRAHAGESLRRIDSIGERLAQRRLDAQSERSDAEDLDLVQAISEFQSRQSGYDAALKTYSTVQRLSLFEYLR